MLRRHPCGVLISTYAARAAAAIATDQQFRYQSIPYIGKRLIPKLAARISRRPCRAAAGEEETEAVQIEQQSHPQQQQRSLLLLGR